MTLQRRSFANSDWNHYNATIRLSAYLLIAVNIIVASCPSLVRAIVTMRTSRWRDETQPENDNEEGSIADPWQRPLSHET